MSHHRLAEPLCPPLLCLLVTGRLGTTEQFREVAFAVIVLQIYIFKRLKKKDSVKKRKKMSAQTLIWFFSPTLTSFVCFLYLMASVIYMRLFSLKIEEVYWWSSTCFVWDSLEVGCGWKKYTGNDFLVFLNFIVSFSSVHLSILKLVGG